MGQVRSGDVRSENHGTDVESAYRGMSRSWGGKAEVVVARLDDDGNPVGNRDARRLAKRLLRRRK